MGEGTKSMHQRFEVVEVRRLNPRTKTLVFDRALPAQPGQFVMAWLPGIDERPYSVAGGSPLSVTVVAVGPFSEALNGLTTGDAVWIRGPLGQGFRLPASPAGKRLLLVGGGYGVAPLLFLAREAIAAGCRVTAVVGARSAEDVLLVDDLSAAGACVTVTTEDGSAGMVGTVLPAVEALMAQAAPEVLYACGPVGMLKALEGLCLARDIPHQLSWEARMRCGMGLCGACEVHGRADGWLACHDGPVSDSEMLERRTPGPRVPRM
jgi:dihydroorotate dehydrogenase electron transfer subunit